MTISIENDISKFPYLQAFIDKFNPMLDYTVFVHGNTIYTRVKNIARSTIVHEMTHMKQQKEVGIENWFHQYLSNEQKRLEWEIEAYKAERDIMHPQDWRKRLNQILPFLCGDMYGNIVTREKALELLK